MRRFTIFLATVSVGVVITTCTAPTNGPPSAPQADKGGRTRARACIDLCSTKCQLHDTPLIESEVPIEYGLPNTPRLEQLVAGLKSFPNACRSVDGGCCPGEKKTTVVKYCAACRAVEDVWRASRLLRWGPPAERYCTDLSPGVCELHGTVLEEGEVEIVYGLLAHPPMEFIRAERTHFPNACDWVGGGCCVETETRELVRYCPKCRSAKNEWRRQNPAPRPGDN